MEKHGDVGAATRTVKRARLEADKRRDVAEKVQDKFYDIDYTKYQKIGIGNDVGFGRVRPDPLRTAAERSTPRGQGFDRVIDACICFGARQQWR